MFPYNFSPNTQTAFIGLGVEGMGLNRPFGPVPSDPYPFNRFVRASFDAIAGPVAVAPQKATPVALTGNGADLSGTMALQALYDLQNQARG